MSTTLKPDASLAMDRDASLRLIKWFSIDTVRAAKILVVGAGAIGNEVLKNLALLGVGNIFIIDRDKIEISNLSRSVLYRESDCDQYKALVAARATRELNPSVNARSRVGDISFDLGLGFIRRMDVVIAALDNVRARHELNSKCLNAGVPWIDAGIDVLDGQVCVYSPLHGACYACYFSEERYRLIEQSCRRIASRYEAEDKIATTPTIASIVAGVQVQEALKLLRAQDWEGRALISRKFSFNGGVADAMITNLVRRKDCNEHFTIDPETIMELKGVSAYTTTVNELLQIVEEAVGAPVTIELNYDLAIRRKPCPTCSTGQVLKQPVERLVREELICETCGWMPDRRTALERTDRLDAGFISKYPDILGEAKLIDLGIPPLEIMRFHAEQPVVKKKSGTRGKRRSSRKQNQPLFVELTGDLSPDLGFNNSLEVVT